MPDWKPHIRPHLASLRLSPTRRFDHAFAGLLAFDPGAPVELDAGAGADRARAALVSANFFSVLGVSPILGRTFDTDADTAPGAHPVAVLTYAAWQRLFSGNPEVVGRTLRLNGHVFTIIGVAPRDFSGLMRGVFPALFVPVSNSRAETIHARWEFPAIHRRLART